MDTTDNNPTTGEVLHNLLIASGTAANEGTLTLAEGNVDDVGAFSLYRNTLIGKWMAIQDNISDTNGPYTFTNNVIVNSGGSGGSCVLRGTCLNLSINPMNYSQWLDNGGNVTGANDGSIANATTGVLVGSSRTTYLGVAGFELAANSYSAITTGSITFLGSAVIR